jgi:hypothetical protein
VLGARLSDLPTDGLDPTGPPRRDGDGAAPARVRRVLLLEAADLPSGVYVYRFQAGTFMKIRKMTVVR